ncbi:uncharacterized protein J7T54_005604 [Emericellopsis cladophorae]|uniref:Uncharacterized protein n=1 Tax=Emericellopsis cladophorae TaxID=2686198 RepID=A0A9Q0BGC8_9HYPO|nr:uncharacterized protein J7T54_005604 [Emericellopsis cladophorae]KAI6783575.1 hypothetical protein J7T54_005604 [Emericellopsis cladophorae]
MCENDINKSLRCILLALYVPTLTLCIAHSVIWVECPLPGVGIMPATFSFISSAVLLLHGRKRRSGEGAIALPLGGNVFAQKAKVNPLFLFLTDATIGVLTLLILCLTWALYPWHSWGARGAVAAYATQPLIATFLIHTWLAGKSFIKVVNTIGGLWTRSVPAVCPHCREYYSATPPEQLMQQQRGISATAGDAETQPLYRDPSFDADAAMRPDANETDSHKS